MTEVNYKEITVGGFTFCGQSVAGIRSCITCPQLGVVFDAGIMFRKATHQSIVLVTHGHADHSGSLHMHAFERRCKRLSTPTYWMPEVCRGMFDESYISQKYLNYGVTRDSSYEPILNYTQFCGEIMKIHADRSIRELPTIHTVPSQGYCIYETKKKLKPEFIGLSSKQIIEIKNTGVPITNETTKPITAYTGDTTIEGVLQHEDFLNADILIMECTYIMDDMEDSLEYAKDRKHIHEKHIVDNAHLFNNKNIILTHVSERYKNDAICNAVKRIQEAFGDNTTKIHYF